MRPAAIRAVVVHRATDYTRLLAAHATRGQAEFFLRSRGQSIDDIEADHHAIERVVADLQRQVPSRWRRATVERAELNRFLFEPDDVVFVVGQDGLVANLAKYLSGQPVIGVNPLPAKVEGVLVRHGPGHLPRLFAMLTESRDMPVEKRTMVEAALDDGQRLLALNEVFVGHRSHQSARYRLMYNDARERHSSSGVIISTGTGATGWTKSINSAMAIPMRLPGPQDRRVAFFVREAWASKTTGATLTSGLCEQRETIEITSEMNDGGVIFGDGIEDDYLRFDWGRRVTLRVAAETLNLVTNPNDQ